ncbi:MAG: ABC transporter ATP-binding protein [Elusimicrobiota bacterium]
MSAIALEGVTRSFGGKQVLRGVSAKAEKGRVIGLLGRNGEGKTTLFRIMLDILAMDSGRVEVLGLTPDGSGRIRGQVGYVPEKPAFHDFMTAAEVFELRSRLFPGWKREKAAELAKRLDLDLGTRIQGASKGTLGKIAWVCAAAHDPKLFLLDEPTSGLDALVRDDVLNELINELHETGKTIVVANHRMEELAGVLDEIWVLSHGVLSGIHEMERLKAEACRITGRLKEGESLPPGIAARVEGGLTVCELLDASAAQRLLSSGVLEGAEKSSIPMDGILKLLLKNGGAS